MGVQEITTSNFRGLRSKEVIKKCIQTPEYEELRDFIRRCLIKDPAVRLKAHNLLLLLTLLLAAHTLVKDTAATTENLTGEVTHNYYGSNTTIMATKTLAGKVAEYKLSEFTSHKKLEKFVVKKTLTLFQHPLSPQEDLHPGKPEQAEDMNAEIAVYPHLARKVLATVTNDITAER